MPMGFELTAVFVRSFRPGLTAALRLAVGV